MLERARINMSGFEALAAQDVMPDVYLYTQGTDGFDIRARMFAPLSGVPEDPATGSANCISPGFWLTTTRTATGVSAGESRRELRWAGQVH